MRLIDADSVLERLSVFKDDPDAEESTHHFMYGIETAREVIESEPTIEPEPARLLTVEDWDVGNNPDIDNNGCLPCWAEEAKYPEDGGWTYCYRSEVDKTDEDYDPHVRYWTKRPTPEQMAGMAWEDGA